jgi:hypothetical protein
LAHWSLKRLAEIIDSACLKRQPLCPGTSSSPPRHAALRQRIQLSNGLALRCPESSSSEAWLVLPMGFSAGTPLRICLRHRYASRLELSRLAKPPASSRLGGRLIGCSSSSHINPLMGPIYCPAWDDRSAWISIGPAESLSRRESVMSRDDQSKMCLISRSMMRASLDHSPNSDGNLP